MKNILICFMFAAAISQINGAPLNITILYETLCKDSSEFFSQQLLPAYRDNIIRMNSHFELVPFGRASYVEHPWNITCQHGPRECLGNVIEACFLAKHPSNFRQVLFVSCCMTSSDPPSVGPLCAKYLGFSYSGVKQCSIDEEGISLQIKNGERTNKFRSKIEWIPTIIYNNVYNQDDQRESLRNFKSVILRKLHKQGLLTDSEYAQKTNLII